MLPGDQSLRRLIVEEAERIFATAAYGRVNTPAFEETELFVRGVGRSSDVVRKEMYTFNDKRGRSLTLKPEGTAPVVRAYIQHGMHKLPQPVKLWYYERMYRFERPQAGRFREHYQLGCEAIGSGDPALDAELIMMLSQLYERLEVPDLSLRLSSMGCIECRGDYRDLLTDFLKKHEDELCGECRERARLNPLRVFDCKQEACLAVLGGAPKLVDHLCETCQEHFDAVKRHLDALGRSYLVDGTLVRGFDYYTRTTFEYECARLGAQKGIGGGGRYDGLVGELGGPETPAIGFGTGMERIVLALAAQGTPPGTPQLDVFCMVLDEAARVGVAKVMHELRSRGFSADTDYAGRKAKGQMKQAARLGARYAVIVGEDELSAGSATVRDMTSGGQEAIKMVNLVGFLAEKLSE